MIDTLTIPTQRTTGSRLPEIDFASLEFGKTFSDHMLVVDYRNGEWQEPQIAALRRHDREPCQLGPALRPGHFRGHEGL